MKELTNKENLDNERKIRSRKIRKILEKLDVSSSERFKISNMYRFANFLSILSWFLWYQNIIQFSLHSSYSCRKIQYFTNHFTILNFFLWIRFRQELRLLGGPKENVAGIQEQLPGCDLKLFRDKTFFSHEYWSYQA